MIGGFMKRMSSVRLMIFSVILLTGSSVMAQDTMTLTLAQCVDMTLERNPEIRIAEKELAKAQAGIWEAYSAILPAVDASANLSHAWKIQTSTIPNFLKPMLSPLAPIIPEFAQMPDYVQLSFGLENVFTYGVRLTQPLFLGGSGIAGIQLANATCRSSNHDLESKRQSLIYQAVNAFYGCILSKNVIEVQQEALKQAEANLNVVLSRYKAGSASGFDRMRAEVDVANLKPEIIASRNAYQSALTGLKTILGLPMGTNIDLQGELEYTNDALDGVSLAELQTEAMKNRPDVFSFEAQKDMAKNGIALARSQFMPKLFFSTDYSYLAMKNNLKFSQDDFSEGFTSALSLQVPLFYGFRNHKQMQKAKLDYKIVLDSEKLVHYGIGAEVEIGYNGYRVAQEKYQSARESISLAEEALRLANLMYQEGVSTQLDVMGSQLALTQARLNYISALYEYQMARYELRRVTGTLKGIL